MIVLNLQAASVILFWLSSPPPSHSVPSAVSSPRIEFTFSEPALADVSADSSFSKMNIDGNITSGSVSDNLTAEDSSKATYVARKGLSEADSDITGILKAWDKK